MNGSSQNKVDFVELYACDVCVIYYTLLVPLPQSQLQSINQHTISWLQILYRPSLLPHTLQIILCLYALPPFLPHGLIELSSSVGTFKSSLQSTVLIRG